MNGLLRWLTASMLFCPLAHATPTSNSGQAYVDECRAAGVPIPPPWASMSWQHKGRLPNPFISVFLYAEVYYYESFSPQGVCVALPRIEPGTDTIKLLGVICQGKASGNACFWDNSNWQTKRQFDVGRYQFLPIVGAPGASFNGGATLDGAEGGTCTSCHAGENAFIVHPGTPLALGDSLMKPNQWYKPLVAAAWPDNPGPSTLLEGVPLWAGESSCLTCHGAGGHRFPQVSQEISGYCQQIENAYRLTMPPSSAGSTAHAKHVDALRAACAPSEIGAYDVFNAVWIVDRDGDGSVSTPEISRPYAFGAPYDYPLAYTPATSSDGTYVCNAARSVIAVYRPSTGEVFVDTNNSRVFDAGDQVFATGRAAVGRTVPLIRQASAGGGRCRSQLGLFVENAGRVRWAFDFNYDNRFGPDEEFDSQFGGVGDLPFTVLGVVGNTSRIGVFRPSTNEWFIDSNGNARWDGCAVDRCLPAYAFGDATEVPIAGPRSQFIATAAKSANFQYLDANSDYAWSGTPTDRVVQVGNIFTLNVLGRFE